VKVRHTVENTVKLADCRQPRQRPLASANFLLRATRDRTSVIEKARGPLIRSRLLLMIYQGSFRQLLALRCNWGSSRFRSCRNGIGIVFWPYDGIKTR